MSYAHACVRASFLVAAAALLIPSVTSAQERTATVVVGEHYAATDVEEKVAGENWRVVWTTPVRLPVLDLGTHGGGLTPERTGGRQSRTLHFQGADGQRYIFRSFDKFLHRDALPEALRNTPAGDFVQKQVSMLLPAAAVVVAPLYDAVGLLHVKPELVVMPDDPRLGEFREEFAGMAGMIEVNPQEGPDDTPGFAGSRRILGADNFLDELDESAVHRVHTTEYLTARLLQFLVGDTDRGSDQWRFAAFPHPSGQGLIWRPIARDHDFAFMRTSGLVAMLVSWLYPKVGNFGEDFESLRTLTYMTYDMDRRFLADVTREQWDSVVVHIKSRLSDDVLRNAVARLPDEWERHAGEHVVDGLRSRRERLDRIANEFYMMVNREADVHAVKGPDRIEIERLSDGSVEVRRYAARPAVVAIAAQPAPPTPADTARADTARTDRAATDTVQLDPTTVIYRRRFLPSETKEIRVYLHGGDDEVQVMGRSNESILVRVIGGGGNDRLVDMSEVDSGDELTVFYTANGVDDVVTGRNTRIVRKAFEDVLPGRPHDLRQLLKDTVLTDSARAELKRAARNLEENVLDRISGLATRDWGFSTGILPYADFRSGTGLLVGVRSARTEFSFRHWPYRIHASAKLLYAFEPSGFGLELSGDRRFENSDWGVELDMSAIQYDAFRFFGYGNNTIQPPGETKVYRDQIEVRPSVYRDGDNWNISLGPIFKYGDPRWDNNSPIDLIRPFGASEFSQLGMAADVEFEWGNNKSRRPRAVRIDAGVAGYPAALDAVGAFGNAFITGRTWIPIGRPFIALRAGGAGAFGDFPVHEAVFLGGRNTLRGFKTDRFAGDASMFGTTELHVPIATVTLLVRGTVGVFGLADAGRVWFEGDSPGGWHNSWGGGAWFSMLGQVLSLVYAHGETGQLYLRLGPSL